MDITVHALRPEDAQAIKEALLRHMPTDPADMSQELVRAFRVVDEATVSRDLDEVLTPSRPERTPCTTRT